ncbi:hypothetical protein J3R30DRAFT_3399880 [Lentinula aciculospora]|uniref:Uncharacterized protein n=1 Tax=Lentinula aciculospora TaxID=153920 RepID=A0A9W9AW95_9AGAR|nr:hypothetical protein J3R30DRAFT_3399880 [Lentinula aciculospora]
MRPASDLYYVLALTVLRLFSLACAVPLSVDRIVDLGSTKDPMESIMHVRSPKLLRSRASPNLHSPPVCHQWKDPNPWADAGIIVEDTSDLTVVKFPPVPELNDRFRAPDGHPPHRVTFTNAYSHPVLLTKFGVQFSLKDPSVRGPEGDLHGQAAFVNNYIHGLLLSLEHPRTLGQTQAGWDHQYPLVDFEEVHKLKLLGKKLQWNPESPPLGLWCCTVVPKGRKKLKAELVICSTLRSPGGTRMIRFDESNEEAQKESGQSYNCSRKTVVLIITSWEVSQRKRKTDGEQQE